MIKQVYTRLLKIIHKERCPRKLALSVALSVFIAFSPFVGFHTAMAFLFSWFFALNVSIILAVSMSINNPWTMLPIYATDHAVGDTILSFFGIDGMEINPAWIAALNSWMTHTVGLSGISVWAFLLGGNLVALALALCIYLFMRYMYVSRTVV